MKKGLMERMAVFALAVLFASAYAAIVHADDLEWDPSWGYHEEEWYDPSDWFGDDSGIDYEDQYYGGYSEGYYGGTFDYGEYGFDDQSTYDDYDYDQYGYDDTGYSGYPYGYDYYTSDWYEDEADFDNWWSD